jgi:hypothetical protein
MLLRTYGCPIKDFVCLDSSPTHRRILHQTISQMFNSIIDAIEKLPSVELPAYRLATGRMSVDDASLSLALVEHCDRFRKFLQLALDYIHAFHNECALFESFTLRLLNICLIGIAYLIEKRSTQTNTRHQMSQMMFRCADIIKQVGQKLLTIALDPGKQRFLFRIQVLKHIIDQPNARAIMDYLLTNDTQCNIYHQILISLLTLSESSPHVSEYEQVSNASSTEQPRQSVDSGHSTVATTVNITQTFSNGEESSHTVNISTKAGKPKQSKATPKEPAKMKVTKQNSSVSEEEEGLSASCSSTTADDEHDAGNRKAFDRSSSASFSVSSASSELTTVQQASMMQYQNIISAFRDLMRSINIPSLTTNDSSVAQRRALTDYLLNQSPPAGKTDRCLNVAIVRDRAINSREIRSMRRPSSTLAVFMDETALDRLKTFFST